MLLIIRLYQHAADLLLSWGDICPVQTDNDRKKTFRFWRLCEFRSAPNRWERTTFERCRTAAKSKGDLFSSRLHKHREDKCVYSPAALLQSEFVSALSDFEANSQSTLCSAESNTHCSWIKRERRRLTCRGSAWPAQCPSWFLCQCENRASWASVEGPVAPSLGLASRCRQENKIYENRIERQQFFTWTSFS